MPALRRALSVAMVLLVCVAVQAKTKDKHKPKKHEKDPVADNIWTNGLGDGIGDYDGNWSLGWKPKAGDTMVFDASCVDHCTLYGGLYPDSIRMETGYTGTLTLTANGSVITSATGADSTIDGKVVLTGARYLFFSNYALSLGANADISGSGRLWFNTPLEGLKSNTGATVSCNIRYDSPRDGALLAAGTYSGNLSVIGNASSTSFRDFMFGVGKFKIGSLTLQCPGTVDLQIDAATNDPTVAVTGDITIDVDSSGDIVWDASSENIVLYGSFVNEITGAGSLVATGQGLTLSGTNDQSIDGFGTSWGAFGIDKGGGTATLVDDFTCSSFVLSSSTFDINGKTLTVSGSGTVTGATLSDLVGGTITVGVDFTSSDTDLIGTGAWSLNVGGDGTVSGATITNCDASGGSEIDATYSCVDGGGNTNVHFLVVYGTPPTVIRRTSTTDPASPRRSADPAASTIRRTTESTPIPVRRT